MKKGTFLLIATITILSLILINSCKPVRYLDKHHAEICNQCIEEYTFHLPAIDSIIHLKDTIIEPGNGVANDFYQTLLLECDSNHQVVIKSYSKIVDSLQFDKTKLQKYLTDFNRVVNTYKIVNNKLYVNNKIYQDSIKIYKDSTILYRTRANVIEKPAITIIKAPVWIWFALGLSILAIIAIIIIAFKK